MHCVTACPVHALTMEHPLEKMQLFQQGMAAACQAVLAEFEPSSVYYLTALLNITPLCDCWGYSTPPLVPDVGILAGDDMVAIEQASLDLVDRMKLIEENVPEQLWPLGETGHLFERVHGMDPYEQVRQCAALGLGSTEYEIQDIPSQPTPPRGPWIPGR
jgi:uncharacterized Fe-S center protein